MLTDVLNASLDAERIPAAIAACELLAVGGNEELLNDGSRVSPLVRAVDFGAPRLAHAALATISRIDPHQSYTGSSRYISALIRMAQASGTRKVLVGHSNPQTAQSLGVVLGQSGLFPIVAGNAREFWDRAHNDPDIELLVLTDFINRPDFAELLQALKSSRQTRRIPVALMVGPENLERAKRVAARLPRVTTSRFVIDESLLARQVDNTMRLAAHRMPSSSERMEFAKQALVQLARIAENPNRYPFYNLVNHQDGLYSALGTPGLSQYACVVLGRIGTPRAQRSLLGIAGNSQLPAELRQVAAQSFANAVKNRGLMLTRNQILAQYDHYNASADESPENQQILGGILDAIEKKTN